MKFCACNSMFFACVRSIIFSAALCSPLVAAEHYVSPGGTATGDGTIGKPWSLDTAFSHPSKIRPGDTIWLRGGMYGQGGARTFTSLLTGVPGAPILVKPFRKERAIVNGGIAANGSFTWYWGFEITNTSLQRTVSPVLRPAALEFFGVQNKAINLIIYNAGTGIGFWSPVGETEVNGCILWGNGHYDPATAPGTPSSPWTRGSGIYAQSQFGTQYIKNVISFRNFTTGMKAYTEDAYADGFHFEGNVAFSNAQWNMLMHGGSRGQRRLKLISNFTFREENDPAHNVQLGYRGSHYDAVVQNNYFVGGDLGTNLGSLMMHRWADLTVQNNTVVSRNILVNWLSTAAQPVSHKWNYNTYYSASSTPFQFNGVLLPTLAAWRVKSGFDTASTFKAGKPTAVRTALRVLDYDRNRAHVVVYNWPLADSTNLSLSAFLVPGDKYTIRDVQNYFGAAAAAGTYDGQAVTVPLNLKTVASIPGMTHLANVHTSKQFNVFVIVREPVPSTDPNQVPAVTLPGELAAEPNKAILISGAVSDDGLPSNHLTTTWSQLTGPGTVFFSTPAAASTSATFPAEGKYVLRLQASDGVKTAYATMTVTVKPTQGSPGLELVGLELVKLQSDRAILYWETSHPSNSFVEYAGNNLVLKTKTVPQLTTTHAVEITGLLPGAPYYTRATSTDPNGTTKTSPVVGFVTFAKAPAPSSLVLSAAKVTPLTPGSLRVTWTTNLPSTTYVEYGLLSPIVTPVVATPVTSHAYTLTGLVSGIEYSIRAWSAAQGVVAASPILHAKAP